MKVGILSDTHNDTQTLLKILTRFREEGISTILHAGDVSSPSTIKTFSGFTVHLAFGNCDYFTGALKEEIILLGTNSTASRINTQEIEGEKVLIIHGNYPQELQELCSSGKYDLVITGHTHIQERKTIHKTLVINPGAASRKSDPPYAYAVYDLEKKDLRFHKIKS